MDLKNLKNWKPGKELFKPIPPLMMMRSLLYRKFFIISVMLVLVYYADTGMHFGVDIIAVISKVVYLLIDQLNMIGSLLKELLSRDWKHLQELFTNTIKWIGGTPYPEGFTLFCNNNSTIAEFAAKFFERIAQFFSDYAAMFR